MTKLHSSKITRSRTKFHQVRELGESQQLQDLTGKVDVVKSTIEGIKDKIGDSSDDEDGISLFSKIAKIKNLRIERVQEGGFGTPLQAEQRPIEKKNKP